MLYIGASMKAPKGQYSIPRATMWQSFVYGVVMAFVSLPFSIITNRSITTPHKLSAFKPAASLRLLLTSYERRRPWTLYLTPGLFLAQFLHVFFVTVFSRLVRIILVPTLANGLEDAERDGKVSDISTIGLSIFILFQALGGTAILCPLEVMSARLTVQRNYTPGAEFEEEDAEINAVNEGGEAVEYAGRDEDVLNLRSHSGEEPYKGLRHCYQRMLEEEGVSALFRAWWLTMLGAVLSGFA
ncbi:hypothetical protein FRC02_009753 [Tulasnella sp. 418]|nr:hypothetical protein FRC02_009753 [Tulasnella sp. 418]